MAFKFAGLLVDRSRARVDIPASVKACLRRYARRKNWLLIITLCRMIYAVPVTNLWLSEDNTTKGRFNRFV
jgi:hypothetical protein